MTDSLSEVVDEWVFPISPVAASRPRLSKGRGGRSHAYYTGPYKRFKEEARTTVDFVLGNDLPLLEGPLNIKLRMVVKKPKTTKFTHPKWDIDNGAKACLDCLNGKLWGDDSQIVSLCVTKEWALTGEEGYFIVSQMSLPWFC